MGGERDGRPASQLNLKCRSNCKSNWLYKRSLTCITLEFSVKIHAPFSVVRKRAAIEMTLLESHRALAWSETRTNVLAVASIKTGSSSVKPRAVWMSQANKQLCARLRCGECKHLSDVQNQFRSERSGMCSVSLQFSFPFHFLLHGFDFTFPSRTCSPCEGISECAFCSNLSLVPNGDASSSRSHCSSVLAESMLVVLRMCFNFLECSLTFGQLCHSLSPTSAPGSYPLLPHCSFHDEKET